MAEYKLKLQTKVAALYIEEMYPTLNKRPSIIENLFQFRKNNIFTGENMVVIADMGEAMWWNRPQIENTEAAWGIHDDGLHCCNLPIFLGKNKTWKSAYNVLLNKNNIPTALQIKFNHTLTSTEIDRLTQMSSAVIISTLDKLGVPLQDICVMNNDLLLKGKKFVGNEQVFKDNIYTECLFITLRYKEEKDLFDRLTSGKTSATAHREITGVLDEYENITKEDFLKTYCEEFKKYLDQFEL